MSVPIFERQDPAAMQQHLATLQRDFGTFDTAKETIKGKPWFGGGKDHIVSKEDLQVVRDNPSKFNRAQVEAARFFLEDPSALGQLDTAARTGEPIPDNRIGQQDVNAAVRDAGDFAGAGTFGSQRPAIPVDGATPEQDAATATLAAIRAEVASGVPSGNQSFTQALKDHQGDTAWLQGYFHALGADQGGALLHNALTGGGEGRTQARQALQVLQQQGVLNAADLSVGQFKTSPFSEETFSLKTLLEADKVQQGVEAREAVMDKTGSTISPVNTVVYDAYDGLLTVSDQQNDAQIRSMAERYGIDPALLGGTVAAEMDFDHGVVDVPQDAVWRRVGFLGKFEVFGYPLLGDGPGVTSVHNSSLKWAVGYLEINRVPGAAEAQAFYDAGRDNAADLPNAIESSAIVMAALTDVRKTGGASVSQPEDMATMWSAYRNGIGGVMPRGDSDEILPRGEGGYPTLEHFLDNRVDAAAQAAPQAGDPHLKIGGNAYMAEPYFDALSARS